MRIKYCSKYQCRENNSNLPQKVIRNGKIIESQFQVKSKSVDVIFLDTPTAKLLQFEGCLLTQNNKLKQIKITTLRIKSSNHNITLILKMNVNDKISMVYELVDEYLQLCNKINQSIEQRSLESFPYKFQLFCPFPKKVYADLTKTLQQEQLVTNATLFTI